MGTIITSYGVKLENPKKEEFSIESTDQDAIPVGSNLRKSEYVIGYNQQGDRHPTAWIFDGYKHQCEKMLYKLKCFIEHAKQGEEFKLKAYEEEFPNSVLLAMNGHTPGDVPSVTKIFKYPLDWDVDEQIVEIHEHFSVLHLEMQESRLCFWAEISEAQPKKPVKVIRLATGEPKPVQARNHIGTILVGAEVWHYFLDCYC